MILYVIRSFAGRRLLSATVHVFSIVWADQYLRKRKDIVGAGHEISLGPSALKDKGLAFFRNVEKRQHEHIAEALNLQNKRYCAT